MAKNIVYQSGDGGITRRLTVGSGVVSGDPVEINDLHGLAITSYSSTDGKADVLLPGVTAIAELEVEAVDNAGDSAIAIGNKLYYDTAATIKVNKDVTNGKGMGYALGAVDAGGTDTIEVALAQL